MNNALSETIICMACGPSLLQSDIQTALSSEHRIIAVNNAALAAGISGMTLCYSADIAWWRIYFKIVSRLPCQRWSCNTEAVRHYALNQHTGIPGEFNSGQQAIHLAACLGAKKIILLGYDCSLRNGLHFHGTHRYGLSNPTAGSIIAWQRQFQQLSLSLENVEIINCSRYTELVCFERKDFYTTLSLIA